MKIYDYNGRKNLCGDRIREARAKRKVTQDELAARLQVAGVTLERNSISRIESGDRFVADFELVIIAESLHVPVLWLLGVTDELI